MKAFKAGELAKQAHVNVETLRYYEREGLLPEPARTEAGYRLYGQDDVQRVRFIKHAQELGFSLKEVRELLALRLDDSRPASEVRHLTAQKIEQIEAKIQSLQSMKAILETLVQACTGEGDVAHCPIMHCLEQRIPDKQTTIKRPPNKKETMTMNAIQATTQNNQQENRHNKPVHPEITSSQSPDAKPGCGNPSCTCNPCTCDPCLCGPEDCH